MRATNQAIGRVIRHGQDYGAIILLDYRFSWNRLFTNISPWIRGISPNGKNFQQAKKTLSDFFRNIHLGRVRLKLFNAEFVHSLKMLSAGCT